MASRDELIVIRAEREKCFGGILGYFKEIEMIFIRFWVLFGFLTRFSGDVASRDEIIFTHSR